MFNPNQDNAEEEEVDILAEGIDVDMKDTSKRKNKNFFQDIITRV